LRCAARLRASRCSSGTGDAGRPKGVFPHGRFTTMNTILHTPPVLTRSCCKLVKNHDSIPFGRTSCRHRFPRLQARMLSRGGASLPRNRWQLRCVIFTARRHGTPPWQPRGVPSSNWQSERESLCATRLVYDPDGLPPGLVRILLLNSCPAGIARRRLRSHR
jgi:hypothetical protein